MVAAEVGAHTAHNQEIAVRMPLGRLVFLRCTILGDVNDQRQRIARAVRLRVARERGPKVREDGLDALRDYLVCAVRIRPAREGILRQYEGCQAETNRK